MTPFTSTEGIAVALIEDDLNTDELAPGMGGPPRPGKSFAGEFLRNRRVGPDGAETDFPLNRDPFRRATILVTGSNFGCGSSRETAVWAMRDFGIRCVVAHSFADSFRENCLRNGLLPVSLPDEAADFFARAVIEDEGRGVFAADLAACELRLPDGSGIAFEMPDDERRMLLEGLDEIAVTDSLADRIAAWEESTRVSQPWLQRLVAQEEPR